MKQETNKEMDLLLRRLGRRKDAGPSTAEDHLDADELSAYVENVLPAAARARYTEHLIECSRCRRVVAQLSSSAGVVTAPEAVAVSAPSALKKFLASLFTPMVLRYAAPALGLIVVAVIGVVVLRRNETGKFVTQVHQPEPLSNNSSAPATAAPSVAPGSGLYSDEQNANATANARPNKQADSNKPVAAPPPNAPPTVTSVDGAVSPQATPQKSDQASAANEPPSPPAAKPAATTDEKQIRDAEARKKEAQEVPAVQPSADTAFQASREEARQNKDVVGERARSPKAKAASPMTGAASIAKIQRGDADKATEDKDDSAETRTVAGRRFRKERGIWIDTAYESSTKTTDVTRGSEQYRGLVADEPAIKTIADRLDGEIIVVWKGRAYRIQ